MYDFMGQQCPVCHQLFRDGDDLVVCPDCGAPYHRECYAQTGHCLLEAKHAPDFEWKPPQAAKPERACPHCGAMNEVDAAACKSCSYPMGGADYTSAPRQQAQSRAGARGNADAPTFDYDQFYEQARARNQEVPRITPDETLEGIPAADWAYYIGPSNHIYLLVFKQMELLRQKKAISFSAFLFGHYYFLYRKAWKPGLACMLVSMLLSVPLYLWQMQVTESPLLAGIDPGLIDVLVYASLILNLVYKIFCGMYGYYLYKKDSAQRIEKIRRQFPDIKQRAFVLSAQGGTSFMAVFLALLASSIVAEFVVALLGPNTEALMAFFPF